MFQKNLKKLKEATAAKIVGFGKPGSGDQGERLAWDLSVDLGIAKNAIKGVPPLSAGTVALYINQGSFTIHTGGKNCLTFE